MSGVNVDFYKAQVLKQADQLDQRLLTNDYVKQIHEKTQVRPAFLFVGVAVFVFLFLVWGIGAQFVTNLIGFAYPLYESYRSLSSSSSNTTAAAATTTTTHSQQQWLTYWIIYAAFSLVESLTDFFLYWIPLYHIVKIAFLVWCFLPQTRGAELIYAKVVEPTLIRYEGRIDQVGRDAKRAAGRVVADVAHEVANAQQQSGESGTGSAMGEGGQ